MDDIASAVIGMGITLGVGGLCSVYEYYRCRKLLRAKPNQSFDDLYREHSAIEYPLLFFGIPGTEIARWKYYRSI